MAEFAARTATTGFERPRTERHNPTETHGVGQTGVENASLLYWFDLFPPGCLGWAQFVSRVERRLLRPSEGSDRGKAPSAMERRLLNVGWRDPVSFGDDIGV